MRRQPLVRRQRGFAKTSRRREHPSCRWRADQSGKSKKDKKEKKKDDETKGNKDKKDKKEKKVPKTIPENAEASSDSDDSGRPLKRRELNAFLCEWLPSPANVCDWMTYVGIAANVCSAREDDEAANWIWTIKEARDYEALAKVPRKFRRVDKLLFVSIEKQAVKLGKDSLLFKTLQGDSSAAMDARRTSTGMRTCTACWRVSAATRRWVRSTRLKISLD